MRGASLEEGSTSAPAAAGDNGPGQGPQTGLVADGRPGPGVPVDNSGVRPTFPGRRERTRSRLARLTGRSTATYSPILEPLLRTVRANNPKEDFDLIQRAFVVAEQSHRGQKRKSGDPYITHPVAVATILAELGLSGTTLAAALLHDTVEDTPYTLADLKADFGPEVAMLVDGVTKLDKVSFGEAAQSETVRKMVVAMAKDIRVLMIKLADRLHNARTWRFVSAESSARKARETLEIFAPLAHRLGMNTIKWELEDLSFAALYPKVYEEIVRMVGDRTPEREKSLSVIRNQIADDLRTARIKATITGRPKHYYSIYQKMIVRDKDFDDINDLMGVRVLVDSVRDCYAALGTLHSRWNPLPGRFKDYIAMPKFNMYQSLHTTVIGPGGKPVEIQIRTHEMHRRAEYGVAAHWKYKDQPNRTATGPGSPRDGDMGWLRSLVDWQQETSDPGEFLDSLRFEINAREVFVFTPKGEVMALPAGSTPVDFAYAVHTEVGHRTIGRTGQRQAGPAQQRTKPRRLGGDLHVEGRRGRAEPGLAALRQERPCAEQDPPVVQQGTARRGNRPRQGTADPGHAEAEPAAAAPDDARGPRGGCGGLQVRRHLGPLRRRGGRSYVSAVGHGEARREPGRQREHRRRHH